MGKFREVRLQVRSARNPKEWDTVHAYTHENKLVASGEWTHKKLVDHARNQLDEWVRNSQQFWGASAAGVHSPRICLLGRGRGQDRNSGGGLGPRY